jgi:hypothetical protein
VKKYLIAVLLLSLFLPAWAEAKYTRSYVRRDGTFVSGYRSSRPDRNRWNNYSSKGNINPYTGKRGSIDPLKPRRRHF